MAAPKFQKAGFAAFRLNDTPQIGKQKTQVNFFFATTYLTSSQNRLKTKDTTAARIRTLTEKTRTG